MIGLIKIDFVINFVNIKNTFEVFSKTKFCTLGSFHCINIIKYF